MALLHVSVIALFAAYALVDPLPALRPRKVTFASTDPIAATSFLLSLFGDDGIVHATADGPTKGNATCSVIKWIGFTEGHGLPCTAGSCGYQLHFVQDSRKRTGPMSLQMLRGYIESLHLGGSPASGGTWGTRAWQYDEFANSHVALAVRSLDGVVRKLRRAPNN